MKLTTFYSLRIAIALVAVGIAFSGAPAAATVRLNGNAGGLCKAAAGPGANVFYFDSQLVQNTSTSVQYVTCLIPEIDPNSDSSAGDIQVFLTNPTSAEITFVCVIQSGYHGFGVNSTTYVVPIVASQSAALFATGSTTPALPARPNRFSPYTLSCAVPAQGQIGLISAGYPELAL